MLQKTIQGVTIEAIQGNIVKQEDCDAIVNAANAMLQSGGGVAGAIHKAAGPGLAEECRPWAPIKPGQAVRSSGHNLPNKHIIHCLGPVYGQDKPADELLSDCYKNTLILADHQGVKKIAFPALSTGAFGYPLQEGLMVALDAVQSRIPRLQHIQTIRFVLYNASDLTIMEALADKRLPQS
jgi:O-acetyl-ADP-ribose deacetylase (regulator of RNase III)